MPPDSTIALPEGTRVAVRYFLAEPDPTSGARLTDVTGTLVEATDERIVVQSRRGRVVVPRASVIATRIIPPRASRRGAPHRSLSLEDLERVMVGAWPPVHQEPLADWVLRFGQGFSARANSALAVGSPGMPLPDALETVSRWYATRGLPAQLCVPVPTGLAPGDDDVVAAALAAGWVPSLSVLVQSAATRSVVEACAPGAAATSVEVEVEVTDTMTEDWYATLAAVRQAPRAAVEAVLHGSPAQRFALVRVGRVDATGRGDDTAPVAAIGRLGVSDGWGGLGAMWVAPDRRRRGLAHAVLGKLATQAQARGCVSLHLQVETTNSGATALYERVGFTTHHAYAYLRREPL